MEKLLESRQGTANALGISLRMVDYLIAEGKLPARKVGRRTLIPRAAIERFVRDGSSSNMKADASNLLWGSQLRRRK